MLRSFEDKGALAPGEVYALERVEVLDEPHAINPGTGGYEGGFGNPAGSAKDGCEYLAGRVNVWGGGVEGETGCESPEYSSGTDKGALEEGRVGCDGVEG